MTVVSYCYLLNNGLPSTLRLKLQSGRWKRKTNPPICPTANQPIRPNRDLECASAGLWGLEDVGCRVESAVPEAVKENIGKLTAERWKRSEQTFAVLACLGGCLKFNILLRSTINRYFVEQTVFLMRGYLTCPLIFPFLSMRSLHKLEKSCSKKKKPDKAASNS